MELEKSVVFTENEGKFFRGPISAVKPKNRFSPFARLLGERRAGGGLALRPLSANCLAPPRDRQRQESIPADPGSHAAVNIAYSHASEHIDKRY